MTEIMELVNKFNNVKTTILKKSGEKEAIESTLEDARLRLADAKRQEAIYAKSIEVLQTVSNIMKTSTIENVENLITKGLHDVIGEEKLQFVIEYESKKNFIQAKYKIKNTETKAEYDIIDSFGGGLADIISILQRIIFIYKFNTAKLLVLDEAGKWISNCKQKQFAKLLTEVSSKLGIQIILITHKPEVASEAGLTICVKKIKDVSVVEVQVNEV